MVVQHNIAAMNANRYYNINNSGLAKSLEKLSSGYQINRAGDNAAGLAVSEKMRSQIGGLTQGVKNAQDGISMIQTFEGALTETDAILQRMKTLADQAANGTYQDDVDREAIQLEFNQLNDELNQIADTDFNGVVMLNGGQMADGLKQVDGKFDYANKAAQITADRAAQLVSAQAEADDKINAAKLDVDAAQAALDALGAEDLSLNGAGSRWNTVDDHEYNKDVADEVWKKLGLTTDGSTDAKATVDLTKGKEVSITFRYNEDKKSWEIRDGYSDKGDKFTKKQLNSIFQPTGGQTVAKAGVTGASGAGGFEFTVGTATTAATINAIFQAKDVKDGDTVTITITNGPEKIYAPDNGGFKDDSIKFTVTNAVSGRPIYSASGVSIANARSVNQVEMKLNDKQMNEEIKDLLDNIFQNEKNGTIEAQYRDRDGKLGSGSDTAAKLETGDVKIGGVDISGTTGKGNRVTIGGKQYWVKLTTSATDTKVSFSSVKEKADGSLTAGTELFEVTLAGQVLKADGKTGTAFTMSGVLKSEMYDYSLASTVNARAGKDAKINNSVEMQAAKDLLAAKEKAYDAAVAAKPMSVDDLPGGVSKSDAYDQSTTTLTYTDHLSLQAGARTKDLVDFTFKYDSAGLGELKANMNCSSRSDGLGTADLSLLTQKDANKAIDKIDNAINKVSMIRATFGATQNRLEHKIDNMNVTKENITSAESRIRDTDINEEMAAFTKNQILSQASQSMLAQANSLPQNVLQLLG